MTYVGIDLAWAERARTGLAVLDDAGRLLASASVRTDDEIDQWLQAHAPDPHVVAIDAPLIVPNETGMRECEAMIGDAYRRYGAGAYPSNRGRPYFNAPRGEVLARRHGWDLDPALPASSTPRCIEVYPHAAIVGLFGLGYTLGYKKGPVVSRRQQLARLLDLLDSVEILATQANTRWAEVRSAVTSAERPMHIDAVEDEVDAVVCAYVAWLFANDRKALNVYGDVETGYIVAPPSPNHPPVPRETFEPKPTSPTAQADAGLRALTTRLREFADARDWHQFHTPKNLAMAIAGEAGELAAELQWLDGALSRSAVAEDQGLRDRVSQEMADVLIYLVRLADVAGIDLVEAANAKVTINETRFPPSPNESEQG